MPEVSVLIPVFNEEESLRELRDEIVEVAQSHTIDLEIIFVDDGSSDSSWDVMSALARKDNRVQCLKLRRNFGKATALQAGIDVATGDLILTIDADLQDDPAELPAMMNLIHEGFDLVSGWKRDRKDPLNKKLPSKFFNWLVSWLSGVKLRDHNCGLKLYRREIFEDFKLYGERHRFIPVLASTRGWSIVEKAVNHRPRKHGVSKYNWRRLPKGFLDLITISFLTGFNQRPQHLIGGLGLGAFGLGALGMLWMAVYWACRMIAFPDWEPLHRRPIVLYSLGAMLLGGQLLCMGFLAELMISQNVQASDSPCYSIADRVQGTENAGASEAATNVEESRSVQPSGSDPQASPTVEVENR